MAKLRGKNKGKNSFSQTGSGVESINRNPDFSSRCAHWKNTSACHSYHFADGQPTFFPGLL
ncbi:MAG: hypothetical protein LBF34_05235, partial [Puniceicoccales bacterium]|nr:hypothetical protein [Puniceicoccales bacterium]